MAKTDEEITKVTSRPSIKNRFLVETQRFIVEYLNIKQVEIPDGSQPIDIDQVLLDIDVMFASDE